MFSGSSGGAERQPRKRPRIGPPKRLSFACCKRSKENLSTSRPDALRNGTSRISCSERTLDPPERSRCRSLSRMRLISTCAGFIHPFRNTIPLLRDGFSTRSIDRRIQSLARFPFIGRERITLAPGLRSVVSRDDVIFYKADARRVTIVGILHGRRDIESEFQR